MDKFEKRKNDFVAISSRLAEKFDKKNRDYGDSYFCIEQFGFPIDKKISQIDFYLQIRRKISRIANFSQAKLMQTDRPAFVCDETEEDTIDDIAIYCIMELIKRKNNVGGNHGE